MFSSKLLCWSQLCWRPDWPCNLGFLDYCQMFLNKVSLYKVPLYPVSLYLVSLYCVLETKRSVFFMEHICIGYAMYRSCVAVTAIGRGMSQAATESNSMGVCYQRLSINTCRLPQNAPKCLTNPYLLLYAIGSKSPLLALWGCNITSSLTVL